MAARVIQNTEEENDDCWSDADESLLAKCDHFGEEAVPSSNLSDEFPSIKDTTSSAAQTSRTEDSEKETPIRLFSKGEYLCVTDLTQQLWCEQQLCYMLMGVPLPSPTADDNFPVPLPTNDRPEVKAGKSVHLARELEVHDIVNIKVTSKADKWALHVLNLLTTLHTFQTGQRVAREVPIFGDPFGTGDLFFGIIDELGFDPDTYSVSLVELKTRKVNRLPGKAQKKQHTFQVHMYKQLWDNLVKGKFNADFFLSKLDLTNAANQPISENLHQLITTTLDSPPAPTLSDLLSQLSTAAQTLICITSLDVEYVLQDTGSMIGRISVEEENDWFRKTYDHCMEFWRGGREVEGVEIEEAWKCRGCCYNSVCEWREDRASMLSAQNQLRLAHR